MEVMITLPATTRNVGEHLSQQHASDKESNRDTLYKIFMSIKFLCRQGLALQGDGCESDSNFKVLLSMLAELDSNLGSWMKRKENAYRSPDIQNEIVKVMGIKLLRNLSCSLQHSPFLAIMADEMTDISNKEQGKYSPRREGIFQKLKDDLPFNHNIRVLCPTRWTVRAKSIASVIKNFDVLQNTWEEASTIVKDLETKSRIRGVSAIMNNFDFVFGTMLRELVLCHADNLSSTLQHEAMSAAAGQELARMTVQTHKSLHNDRMFDIFEQM